MQSMFTIVFIAFGFSLASAGELKLSAPDSIYTFVEQMPEYPGGDREMINFILKNLETPATTDAWCSSFRVRFVIDTDGSVINPVITKSCGPWGDERILRLVKMFPKFKPGFKNGKAVKIYFTLPIACLKPGN